MNKEIDWHGCASLLAPEAERIRAFNEVRAASIASILAFLPNEGAWPQRTECPVGWDERDAQV